MATFMLHWWGMSDPEPSTGDGFLFAQCGDMIWWKSEAVEGEGRAYKGIVDAPDSGRAWSYLHQRCDVSERGPSFQVSPRWSRLLWGPCEGIERW